MRALIGPALIAALWIAAALSGWPSPRVVPSPQAFARTALEEVGSSRLWLDAAATSGRVLAGLSIAIPAGALTGLLLASTGQAFRSLEPTLGFARSVPPILTFPLLLLGLGYGEESRIAAVAAGTFGIVALQVGEGVSRAPRERADAVRLAGLRGLPALVRLGAFEALPSLFTSARLALAAAMIISVVSEMLVGAVHGLGARALEAQLAYRPDQLWLVIAVTGALGSLGSSALTSLERRVVRWPP